MARRQRQTDTVVSDEGGITRQRRWITFAEVSEDQTAQLFNSVARMLHLLAEGAALGLERLLQTVSRDVIKPSMIRAPYASFLDVAVFQRCASVRTVKSHKAETASAVAEKRQFLAKNRDRHGNVS